MRLTRSVSVNNGEAPTVIVTNLHVLLGETAAIVKLANGDVFDDLSVLDADGRRDLAS